MVLPPEIFINVVELTPLVSIDLIVFDPQGSVLLGLRTNRPAQNTWFVPGGRVGKDECIADAFARISDTELGTALSINDARFLGVYEHFYADNFAGKPGFGTHYIVLAYQIHLTSPLPALPEDQHADFHWFQVDTLLTDERVHANTKAYFQR